MEITEVECVNPRCRKPVTLIKPSCEVLGGNTATIVVFSHGELQRCASCGQGYVPQLKDISNLNFVWRAAQSTVDPLVVRNLGAIPPTTT